MSYEVLPYKSVGCLQFGDSIQEARQKLNKPFKSFRRTPQMEIPCDYFDDLGVFVYYKYPGEINAVEFASPANVIFDEMSLHNMTFRSLEEYFRSNDESVEVDEISIISFKFGISIYAPDADEEGDAFPESVLVFEKGYYD